MDVGRFGNWMVDSRMPNPQHTVSAIALDIEVTLRSIYEEVMWLSRRPGVTAGMARAWYAGPRGVPLRRKLCQFSGMVSEKAAAAAPNEKLVLEHYMRRHWELSALVERHLRSDIKDPDEFVRTVVEVEKVHITTSDENIAARKAKGDYLAAKINLIPWASLPSIQRQELWRKMIQGKVTNATEFDPRPVGRSRRIAVDVAD